MSSSHDDTSHIESVDISVNTKDKTQMVKQLSKVVCICKGIPLSRFLPALKCNETVEDVHEYVGSGDGGCRGRRCSPRVRFLLKKYSAISDKSSLAEADPPRE